MTLLATILMAVAAACSGGPVPQARVPIAASVYPMAYFAEQIGGDDVTVHTLVPPGVNAHAFEPSAADLRLLGDAAVVIVSGLGLEPWLGRALDALADDGPATLVEAAAAVAEADDDPHVWLDPVLAQNQVRRVRDGLAKADPANAAAYAARAEAVLASLDALHAEFAGGLTGCRRHAVVTTHAAYGHLAARYGFEQVSIVGLDAEGDVSPRRLADVVDRIEALGLRHLLVEPALSDRLARVVERETGAELLAVHPLGSVTEAELADVGDYTALMRDTLASLRLALDCGGK